LAYPAHEPKAHYLDRPRAALRKKLWKLNVNPDHTATLTCEDGNSNAVYQKAIEYTDFPLPEGR
jgi:hypothetical protein